MHRLVIALVTLLGLIAGSVVAGYLLLLSGSPDRLAAIAPAGTAAYVNVYLNPSVGQQLNLEELIGRLPGFADEASLDAKLDQIIGNLLSGTGIDYQTQVKPWLGDQLALAAWPAEDSGTAAQAVVMLAVKDSDAASDAIAGIVGGETAADAIEPYRGVSILVGEGAAYAFIDGTLVIGQSALDLHPIIDVAQGGEALADMPAFQVAMDRVPADHLASAFIDLASVGGSDADEAGIGAASAALVAEAAGLRLSGSMPVSTAGGASDERSTVVDWMPAETLAAAVIFDLPGTLDAAEDALGGTPGGDEALGLLDTVRALAAFGLGLDLDADLLPLLDREAGLAITSIGTDGVPRGQLILRPLDADAAASALERVVDRLVAIGAEAVTVTREGIDVTTIAVPDLGDVAFAQVEGIVIVGLSVDDVLAAIAAHDLASGALPSSEAYGAAFALAGTPGGSEAFVDLGALVDLGVLDAAGLALPDDARDILSELGAFGLALPPRADSIEFHAAITVPDRLAE